MANNSSEYGINIGIKATTDAAISTLKSLENSLKRLEQLSGKTTALDSLSAKITNSSKEYTKQMDAMVQKTKVFNKELGITKGLSGKVFDKIATAEVKAFGNAMKDTSKDTEEVAGDINAVRDANVELAKKMEEQEALLTANEKAFHRYNEQLQQAQRALELLGKAKDILGVPAKFNMSAFNDWQDEMAKVQRTYSDTPEEFDLSEATESLQDITMVLATSLETVAEIASIGGQLGVAAKDMGTFTQAIAQVVDVTGVNADEASEGIARIVKMSRLMADGVVVDTETIANAYGKVANAVTQLDLQAVASTEISPSS